jgi:hypothetical protein
MHFEQNVVQQQRLDIERQRQKKTGKDYKQGGLQGASDSQEAPHFRDPKQS